MRRSTLRFASLGSGSRGNALLVEAGTTRLLVDCGFATREVAARLGRLGYGVEDLSGVLVTHEHADHARGVGSLARRAGIPVWMTPGTHTSLASSAAPAVELFNCHEPFAINDLCIEPYPVPHDAREPAQFVFGDGVRRVGVLTDAGHITRHIETVLGGCDALVVECNHDSEMLQSGPYPPRLKARVGGDHGHLSNAQTAELLGRIDCSALQYVVAAHLSEQNNCPRRVREALGDALDCAPEWINIADQDVGTGWCEIQ